MPIITQKTLKQRYHYDPVTGVFTNRKTQEVAGCINPSGYRIISLNGQSYPAARLAFLYITGSWPTDLANHINHRRDDDRWANLRDASRQEVSINKRRAKNNTSGHTGVCWIKTIRKWRAQITISGAIVWLGDYATKEEAVAAREHAEHQYGFHANHGWAA